jgi:putative membrane protein
LRHHRGGRELSGAEVTDMLYLLIRLAVSAGAVLLAQWLFGRWIQVSGGDWTSAVAWTTALIFAVVLGILNALVRPILLLVTCPLNFITLGLFTFVVNALVFWLAAVLVGGVDVTNFVGALLGSLTVTICTAVVDRFIDADAGRS